MQQQQRDAHVYGRAGQRHQRPERPVAQVQQQAEALVLDQVAGRGGRRPRAAARAAHDGQPHGTAGRAPTADEVKRDAAFVTNLKDKHGLTDAQALTRFCLLCLNSNEFVYLD